MKCLLVAVNAKYIHSNLGVYSLKRFADQSLQESSDMVIEIGEYTINHQLEQILQDIYKRKPDIIGFSCYIWNMDYVEKLVRDVKKVLPDVRIWLGGPEVSYDAPAMLEKLPEICGIMAGEGEETFASLMEYYRDRRPEEALREIPGLAVRKVDGTVFFTKTRPIMDMSRLPFSYENLEDFEHRIIYYESSRGCPYSCSYCLSSIDKSVRFRDLSLVEQELAYFLEHRVPQVKFVDRTFNCKKSHAMAIWKYILEHDNGVTNFHFEISADLLGEEELELLAQMRPGLVQLEIGVQTTNPDTIREIRRKMDLEKLSDVVVRIQEGRNIHQHLDLIAGLPFEGFASFQNSFNDVYAMRPEQLQMGFLKVLKGSYMAQMAEEYGLVYRSEPPYEVLSTKWLSYEEILRLKAVEEMVEVYYNSGQFGTTISMLEQEFASPYEMFEALADDYETKGLFRMNHNRIARYEILFHFIEERFPKRLEEYRDSLMYDLYLRENVKSRPSFARDQAAFKTEIRDFFIAEGKQAHYLQGYEGYDSRQMSKMAHIEVMGDGSFLLFDYLNREPLHHNARAVKVLTGGC